MVLRQMKHNLRILAILLLVPSLAGCSLIGVNHQLNRSIQFYQEGNYPAAQHALDQLLIQSPNHILGRLYYGWTLYFQNDLTGALACFQEVTALVGASEDELGDAWHGLARCYYFQCNYQEAKEAAMKSLFYSSENMGLWLVLGWSELYIGHYELAEDAFTTALALEAKNPEAWLGIGWSSAYQLDFDAAHEAVVRAGVSGCSETQIQELVRDFDESFGEQ